MVRKSSAATPSKVVTGVRLTDTRTGDYSDIDVDGVFIAIAVTTTDVFRSVAMDKEDGYIQTIPGTTRTSVPVCSRRGMCKTKSIARR